MPSGQDLAFDRGEIDIGITRPLPADRSASFESRLLFRESLVVAVPKSRKVKGKRIRIADLAGERRLARWSLTDPANVHLGIRPHMPNASVSRAGPEQGEAIVLNAVLS